MDISGIVTIRFQRLTDNAKSNADAFLLPYGCAGADGESRCKERPVLLLTSNIQQSAACAHHVTPILNSLIDGILRSRNGERGYGFLRQPEPTTPPRHFTSVTATTDTVWQTRLDDRYEVVVLRATTAYAAVLVIRDGTAEIFRADVGLAYNAVVGPDAADVQEWMDTAISVVDASKPPNQLIAEALDRIEGERRTRIEKLRSSADAAEAYKLAVQLYRSSERAVDWLITGSAALNGRAPAQILDEPDGLERLQRLLNEVAETLYPLS